MSSLESHMAHYRAEHRTLGCRITHMIGVPMIASAIVVVFFYWPAAIALFVVGWAFQLAGHRFFEHNRPVLTADPKNGFTYLAAVIFVGQEWYRLLTGRPIGGGAPPVPKRAA